MFWIKYTVQKGKIGRVHTFFCSAEEKDNLLKKSWENFCQIKRDRRLSKLVDIYPNVEDFNKDNLATISELSLKYEIVGIYMSSSCYGCRYDRPGQDDHMECDTGCLHDPDLCSWCIP